MTSELKIVKNRFGTFGGVFTPSILTILGVIMFMRANFVTGQAGIGGAILILVIAKAITLLTSLSIGAISTNMKVKGGGAYYMISRVLGPEFGGAVGLALFLALALSVPFYVIGFTEALIDSAPGLAGYELLIMLSTAALLFAVAYVGAGWAIRTQYFIMIILVLSIIAFLSGAALHFEWSTFQENWKPFDGAGKLTFWAIFAIYFPAVTGIDAGVNMSGDLEDPARSIPKGSLAAVGVGFLVYFVQILICGGAFGRTDLIENSYPILKNNALFGATFLVAGGVFAATLSSALGSYLSGPRVLQAISRDPILPILKPFGKGTAQGDEPRRALILVGIVTVGVLIWASLSEGGDALNAVAAVVTMFFLFSYGTINVAAFMEGLGANPSFRPRFRAFHWVIALLAAVGCIGASFLINQVAALSAAAFVAGLVWYVKARNLKATFGDARRGFVFNAVRNNLLRLMQMDEDTRNWRPTALIFCGNPENREALIRYAIWLESRRGIAYLANVLVANVDDQVQYRESALKQLRTFCIERDFEAFPVAVVADSLEDGTKMLLQSVAVGPLRPNLAIFGWRSRDEDLAAYARQIRLATNMGTSTVLVHPKAIPQDPREHCRIDVWWRGQKNGALMVMLAHLLTRNFVWSNTTVRVLRVMNEEAGRAPAMEALQEVITNARLDAVANAIVSERPFEEILRTHSADADCIFLGFEPPEEERVPAWHDFYNTLVTEDMPSMILVSSCESEGLLN